VHQLSTPEALFDKLLSGEPGRPFVTFYDEASGERSELSRKSLANWVAKTHFLLSDELGLGVGDTALVAVDAHWIAFPILLGCLTAGLSLTDSDTSAAVAFTDPDRVAAADGVPDVYAVAREAAAAGFGGTAPEGAADYVTAVRPQPDAWSLVQAAATDEDDFTAGVTRADAVRQAVAQAQERGLGRSARLLRTAGWNGAADWVSSLLVPLAVGGSIVLLRNSPDAEVTDRRAAQERVDAVW